MILPIIGYGHPVLRETTQEIGPDYPRLAELIANMFETMYHAQGVGLAAPQIGLAIRVFVVDGSPMETSRKEDMTGFKGVFINPVKVEETGTPWGFEEGCLSIPDVRETVMRPEHVTLRFMDEHFQEHVQTWSGVKARILQHEYDHLEGKLFTDYLSPMRKQVLRTRLGRISAGEVSSEYPMKFSRKK
jgi:peptide deformylase